MRLHISKSKNSASLYVIKSVYNSKTQSNSSKIVEKLGTETELREKLDGKDPYKWANEYIAKLNKKEKENKREILVKYSPTKMMNKDERCSFNGGYLFLQSLYHQLNIHQICNEISVKYKFTFHLDSILSRLMYGRILFPSSKLNTCQLSSSLLEPPDFELQHVYRALEVIAKESDFIQASLYKNSLALSKRNDKILYYDCTNYFFETEEENGLRQYGPSKEHRTNPIVEMGLFMDGDGIPLAFSIHSGNTNEQQTLQPLEKQILKDFSLSKFVVCTDAGLSSTQNRKFNDIGGRAFITTQSIKKLKAHLKEWALDPNGWALSGSSKSFHLDEVNASFECTSMYQNATFFKERWINEDGLEQKLIVTYCMKFKDYQRSIRSRQIERAYHLLQSHPSSIKKSRQNDYKRFIQTTNATDDGEIAENNTYSLDQDIIAKEEAYDGFYGVCTNLEDDAAAIVKINHNRWEIEECFRLLKTDFKARPVFLSRDDRIKAHFTTCFLSLTLFRYLEKKLNNAFTSSDILHQLKHMNFYSLQDEGYIPTYTRTDFTDTLHESFGFRTDYQIIPQKQMEKIFKMTKK
ncbi:MAG: IS1634 family transposase [Bacteroidia bacterium]|nr:IS1634 family transposase [Bacteroidia bacterium]